MIALKALSVLSSFLHYCLLHWDHSHNSSFQCQIGTQVQASAMDAYWYRTVLDEQKAQFMLLLFSAPEK